MNDKTALTSWLRTRISKIHTREIRKGQSYDNSRNNSTRSRENKIINGKANLTIKSIYEEVPEDEEIPPETEDNETVNGEIGDETEVKRNLTWLWVVIGALVIGIVLFIVLKRIKKKNKKRKRQFP